MSVALGVVQMAMSDALEENVAKAIGLVREAASRGATVVLLPELFEGYYWPQAQRERFFERAHAVDGHPFIGRFQALASELGVVLPLSFFERAGHAHYNSLVMIDATGEQVGLYRKSHIPDGPGYMEKYYFTPGDTGFKAFATRSGTLGRCHLLGSVVPGNRACDGAARRRGAAVSNGDRQRAGGSRTDGHQPHVAARDAWPRCRQRVLSRRRQSCGP